MAADANWPITRFGQDIFRAVPHAQNVVGGVPVQRASLIDLPTSDDLLGFEQLVTSSATRVITPVDIVLIYNRTVAPAATQIDLPAVASRLTPLVVVDWAANTGTYPITFVPFGSETIMGQAEYVFETDSDHARVELWPYPTLNGWYIRP